MIHGGNFMGGSKDWELIATEAEHFARAGYVVFNIDYRVDGRDLDFQRTHPAREPVDHRTIPDRTRRLGVGRPGRAESRGGRGFFGTVWSLGGEVIYQIL